MRVRAALWGSKKLSGKNYRVHLFWALAWLAGIGANTPAFFSSQANTPKIIAPVSSIPCCFVPAKANLTQLPNTQASAHAASIVGWPDDERLILSFAGSREGSPDVKIVAHRLLAGKWQGPVTVLDRATLSLKTLRYIRKLGNPIVFADPHNAQMVHLICVGVSIGGWATSRLYHLISYDRGHTWSDPRPLRTSALWNLSSLVRTPALATDHGFLLPTYHELLKKRPQLWWLNGRTFTQIDWPATNAEDGLLQPALISMPAGRVLAFMRSAPPAPPKVMASVSDDFGHSWGNPFPLPIGNTDSSVAAARLTDGRILLVGNMGQDGRQTLSASVHSGDGDLSTGWSTPITLVHGAREYSYPSLWLSGENIDLVFTWERSNIAFARFTYSALDQHTNKNEPLLMANSLNLSELSPARVPKVKSQPPNTSTLSDGLVPQHH